MVSFTAALAITALLIKTISWQYLLSENQTKKCSLKIFVYSWEKTLCLSEALAVTEVLQCNIHLLLKETGQIIHVIVDHTVLILLLLLILRVRKCRILHGFPQVSLSSHQDGNVSFLVAVGSLCDQRGGMEQLPKTGT